MAVSFTPTDQQQNALDCFATGESLAIEAGAGTGKTSTLTLLAASTPRRGQYVAFNKAIVEDSRARFPQTVTCSTAHSLAFRAVGKKFGHRLNSGRMRSHEIAHRLGLDRFVVTCGGMPKVLSGTYLAGMTMRAATRFCQSADMQPSGQHLPYVEGIDGMHDGERGWENNDAVRMFLEPFIEKAWADLASPTGQLPYRHEHYLKTWHLSDPTIGADFIMFDEAQDASPVMLAIVQAQTHAQIVWVGDSQQQIYAFTGAINALASVAAMERAFLTQSFRFGQAIADHANMVLDELAAEIRIQGADAIASIVGDVPNPDAILTRTNAEAVRNVLDLQAQGRRPFLVGGGGELIGFARAAQQLMNGQPTDHQDLACFTKWEEVQEYVSEDAQGHELRLKVSLIDDFTVPAILTALEGMDRAEMADVIVSTAHKSKGREWNSVRLGGDFPDDADDEELRLLYVAATRARRALDVSAVPFFNLVSAP